MMEFSINKFFQKEECNSIIEYVDSIGVPFSYDPKETWDCKRIYNENFKTDIINKLKLNYQNNEFKLWFDLNEFEIKDVNVSLTKYYNNRWLDLHIDSTSQFTTVIILSESFNDGRFAMSNSYNDINNVEKYHLNIGESISFDGTKIYHGVMPVTNGVRCALNIWTTNTDFKYRPLKNNKSII
jgi:predicted 2-oxoglutarate/Fe(II)-dependent dioxygenase YbiX